MLLAVTPGEPAGIGPELLCRYAAQQHPAERNASLLVAFASKELLEQTVKRLDLELDLVDYQPGLQAKPNTLAVNNIELIAEAIPGTLNVANAQYVLNTLQAATDACIDGSMNALVTGPLQKSIINEAGIPFTGHTEYLCERANKERVVMMLATEGLRVALATTHLPLLDVPAAIQAPSLTATLRILHHDLVTQFGIKQPHILVCGLNPHAGESGHMGREEIDVIEPVLQQLNREGMHLTGPLPADTLFTPRHLDKADAVLAMYHDQGLPVLKFKGFGNAVNITLGLPFIRTSVDHGTALDLAGKGVADLGSLQTAIAYAEEMITAKSQYPQV